MNKLTLRPALLAIALCLLQCKDDSKPVPVVMEPAAYPTGFAAVPTGTTTIDVTWVDAAGVEKYLLLGKTGAGTYATVTDSVAVSDDADWTGGSVARNITQGTQLVTFGGLAPNTAYSFVIYPYNLKGTTPLYKNDASAPEVSATTLAVPGEPPFHVTAFTAIAASSSGINLSWTDASGASKYLIVAKTGAGTFPAVADGGAVANDSDWSNNNGSINVAAGVQAASFTGLAANTSYQFQIFPYTEGGTPSPNFKVDGTIPSAAASTQQASGTPPFDAGKLVVTQITVSGNPYNVTTDPNNYKAHPQPSDVFIYAPKIILAPRPTGESVVAWHDAGAKVIRLTFLTSLDGKVGSDIDLVTGAEALGGFALLGTDYIVGMVSGAQKEKFTVRSYSASFVQGFSTDLTGTAPLSNIGSKQSPLKYGSGRMAVDPTIPRIGVFLSHEMLWPDMTIHQGGLFKFLDNTGAVIGGLAANGDDTAGGSNWLYSHCLDNRLVVSSSKWAVTSVGDAAPRAIPIRMVQNNVKTDVSSLFAIDGPVGDNDAKTQMGGLVALNDGTYVITFSTSVGRSTRDVSFMRVSSTGAVQTQKFLTTYTSATLGYAINVKSARYGANVLVAWEETSTGAPTIFKALFAEVDANGNFVKGPTELPNVRFNRGDDFVNFSNGDIGWVTGETGKLKVYRVKL